MSFWTICIFESTQVKFKQKAIYTKDLGRLASVHEHLCTIVNIQPRKSKDIQINTKYMKK